MKKSFRGIAPLIITMVLLIFVAVMVVEKGSTGELRFDELIQKVEEKGVE